MGGKIAKNQLEMLQQPDDSEEEVFTYPESYLRGVYGVFDVLNGD